MESKTYFFLGQKPKTWFFVAVAKKPGFCLRNLVFWQKVIFGVLMQDLAASNQYIMICWAFGKCKLALQILHEGKAKETKA